MSVRATIQDETTKIQGYIRKMAPNDDLLDECLWLQEPREKKKEKERPSYRDKHLHGMYHRQIEEMAEINEYTSGWIRLLSKTAKIITSWHHENKCGVYHTRHNPRSWLCKDASRTVEHITARCRQVKHTWSAIPNGCQSIQEHLRNVLAGCSRMKAKNISNGEND